MNVTLTSKGQLTVPKAAREVLHLKSGARLSVKVIDGRLELTPLPADALAVRGILKSPRAKVPGIAQMDAGISRALSEKHNKKSA